MQTEVIVLPVFFAMIGFVVWVLVNGWQRRQQVKGLTDFNTRLLDRLGSTKDFSEFLQSEGGARLLDAFTIDRGGTGPRDRILRAVQLGVVVLMVGLGFLLLSWWNLTTDHEASMLIGVIAVSLGLGLLLSSAASYWVGRNLGVLDAKGAPGDSRDASR